MYLGIVGTSDTQELQALFSGVNVALRLKAGKEGGTESVCGL